jgi:diaminohydroxyphosphoribosylaminopyrimidine deaminase/5-amino-6-(5-phosphoribosylamino)uracil reductase
MDQPSGTGAYGAAEEIYMRRALELAERGRGRVSPNPLVGCVLVNEGQIVGEGWHSQAGEPHAEAEALHAAGPLAAGATAYVTLEPCAHYGRTPPCTEALIEAGVQKVVVAAYDPNPKVNGAGVRRLREAGIEVVTGVLQDEAHRQNEVFRTSQLLGRPFVLYKSALSLDGKVALTNGPARWISGEAARARVHQWRDEYDAVAVGIGTVLADDPQLTTRLQDLTKSTLTGAPVDPAASFRPGRTPIKVIFDSDLRTPPRARLFEPGPGGEPARVIVVAGDGALQRNPDATPQLRALLNRGAEVILVQEENGKPQLKSALTELLKRGVTSMILEGGGQLAWAFLEAELIDRVAWFVAPVLLGGTGAPGPLAGRGTTNLEDAVRLPDMAVEVVGADLLVTGHPDYPVVLADDADVAYEDAAADAGGNEGRSED